DVVATAQKAFRPRNRDSASASECGCVSIRQLVSLRRSGRTTASHPVIAHDIAAHSKKRKDGSTRLSMPDAFGGFYLDCEGEQSIEQRHFTIKTMFSEWTVWTFFPALLQ